MQQVIFLISASLGNFILAGYFLQALLFPTEHIDFVYSMGFVIFLLEFLNIHSTGMLMGSPQAKSTMISISNKGFLLVLYSVFYLLAFSIAQNYYVVVSAVISFISKLFFKQALPKNTSAIAISSVLLVTIPLVVALFSGLLETVFPFPEEVYMNKPANTSGLFVEVPQTLMFWGVLYYSMLGVYEIVSFIRSTRK